jgi:hypothetical protein
LASILDSAAQFRARIAVLTGDRGEEVLGHARKMPAALGVPAEEFRFLGSRLAEALDDALRVAARGDVRKFRSLAFRGLRVVEPARFPEGGPEEDRRSRS